MPSAEAALHNAQPAKAIRLLGLASLAAGLLGHGLAAQAIGGTYVAYRDYLLGFLVLTAVSGLLLYAPGRKILRPDAEYAVPTLGVLQAGFGLLAYLERFSFHG